VDLNPTYPRDDVFDYQSMKSGEDRTSGILVHEDLTIAADSSTLADFLHANDSREKEVNIVSFDFFLSFFFHFSKL